MKKQKWIRKGMAFVLSLAMVAGLVPAMSGGANTVQAATGTGTEPSVSAYATKTQLMDGTFAPNAEGTAANYGKIVFGKNSSGNPQEWYILGKDGGVSGDNTIIFAASPIAKEQVFNSNAINKIYEYEAGTGYGESAGSTTVVANHYGASDLRVALQGMATNKSYFTTAEQGLMNATTVTTNDTKILNNSVPYTTTDKLYALQGDNNNNKYLWAGSSDSTVLAMSSYWSEGSLFWLRSPYDGYDRSAFRAWPGDEVDYNLVTNDYAVQPASNLNLKSVLFASSAKAASSDTVSGTLTDGTAMTLRINGTGKNIGTVTYNNTTGDIKATKGSTEGDVALVVQGNDETNDWYYSKQITGTEIVKVSDIVEESNTPSSIDLSTCKIWLEITDTDGMIYAVGADKEVEKINTTYVTKEQLMNSFKPYSDGTAANYGKIVFGKNSSGTAQEWYILGKDEGVSGDNTIIFAASPIATEQTFEDDAKNNKAFQSSFGVYVSNPSEVYPNHYGASDLRVALQDMATKASYFTTAEQGLMNATTVTTKDTKNSNVTYTTTDKLYALQGDLDNQYLWAGTSDSTVLAMNSYWSNGSRFRLRSPFDYGFSAALLAYPGQSVGFDGVIWALAVQPASNLNLSSVLFASSAKAASSDTVESHTIASGTAMTLRLNGTGKNIGTVTYNSTIGDIKATKGSTEGDVALVVQGNDGINDWYYSKKIDAAETVNASDIMSALNLSSDIDLSACKIWLEITDTDGMIYAVGATEVLSITSVEITDIDTPVSNTALDTEAACATTGVSSTTLQITWTPSGSTAGYNTSYTASITLTADTGYEFTDSTTATVLGNSATSVTKNADGTLTVTYTFSATEKRVIGSVTAPKVPTNNIFTTYYGYEGYDTSPVSGSNSELGTQATVTFTDSVNPNTEAMDVTWSIANAGGAAYDQTPGAKNTFRWTIPAEALTNYSATDCQGYDATTGTITGTVAITNKDYTPVTITGTDSGVAYTGETIDVSQYFTIDSHAETATYSLVTGVDGGTGVGTLSGTTLTVTKTGTFKIKVETLANGIYGAGEKTITLTVSNGTIEYTATDYSGTYDGQPHSISVNVTNPEGTIISYSTDGENYGSDNPSFTNAGNYTVYYRITKDNYNTISENSTVNVAKAASAPNKPDSTMDVDYGKEKVSDITTLPEGWAWQDADKDTALTVGTAVKATAVYTGADKGNYETESVEISITRAECTHATTEVKNAKDATCTEKGYSGDTCCTVCGKVITAGTDINALGHDFADTFTTDKEATCKEAGSKSKHCSRCEEVTEVTPIPKKEHTWDSGTVTKAATCTEKGVKSYKCTVDGCDGGKTEDIEALGHDYASEFTVDKEATCKEVGSKSKHCSRCDEVTEVTPIPLDKSKHGETEVVGAVEATCKEAGFTGDTKCKACGEILIPGTVIDKLTTHSYVNGVCSVCDDIFKTTVNGVTYQVMTETGADGKPVGKLVTVSGNEISQVAVAVTGTDDDFAVSDGKVTVPSEITGSGSEQTFVVTKIAEDAFSDASVTEIVIPATVTEVGTGAFGTASTITFKGNTAPSGIAGAITETVTTVNVPEGAADSYRKELDENANIVEVHTHTYADTWTYDETHHWHASTCGHETEVSDKAEHTLGEWVTVTEATEDAEGVKERSCSCGYKETAKIDKLAHTIHVKDTGTRVEPTCEKKGSITYKCTKCGEVMEVVELAATGHKWDAGKVTKEATETAEGVKTYTCSVCGKTKTEAIPKKTATTQEPPKKGDVVKDDKTSVKIEVTDVKKKEVEYKEPANKKAKTVSIPATVKIDGVTYKVTKVDDNAFKNNKTVTKVTVGSNIKTIGKNAFSGATKLKTVSVGKNVTEVGANAFKGCSSLTSVTLPSKATKIGANAFSGCKKLKTIKITSTKLTSKTVSKNAFKGLTKATTIKVPKKKLSAYKKLFKQKGLSSKVTVKGY